MVKVSLKLLPWQRSPQAISFLALRLRLSVEVGHLRLVAKEAGDDDLRDVRSVGTPAAHTHHSGGQRNKNFNYLRLKRERERVCVCVGFGGLAAAAAAVVLKGR